MKIVRILLIGIGILTASLPTDARAEEVPIAEQDMLVTSSDFEEVSALEQGALEWLQELGASQGVEEIPEQLDYEKAVKVYVNTDIVTVDSSVRETLLNALEAGDYVWVIPASTAYGNFQVTVARGLPLSEDAKPYLTENEQKKILDNEGKWEITEVALDTVSPYIEQLNAYASQLADCTRVVITGSQTGFGMPVAVGFDDTEAKYFVGLGFQYPVAEGAVRNTSIYEYDTLAERAKGYAVDQGAEMQWSGDELQQTGEEKQWGGLVPAAAQSKTTYIEETAKQIQSIHGWQIAIPVLVISVFAGVVILQKRRSK